jgi:hypothetical protein
MKYKKSDFLKHENDHAMHVFCTLISGRKFNQMLKNPPDEFDIELKINGVEADFLEMVEVYRRQMDDLIKDKARELIEAKLDEGNAVLEDSKRRILKVFDLLSEEQKECWYY